MTRRTASSRPLQADHCYVTDRWFAQYTLWNDIVAAESTYVCRIRDNTNLDAVVEERPVSITATAGVLQCIRKLLHRLSAA